MLTLLVSRSLVALSPRFGSTLPLLILAICLIGGTASTVAQPGIKSDLGTYPEGNPPTLPAAGGKIFDPVFGSEVMRVTDERDGRNLGTAYAYWPTFNSNNTRLLVQDDDGPGLLYTFDPVSFQLGAKERLVYPPGDGLTTDEDALWSANDPDVLFLHRGAILWAYNVGTRTYSVIGDMTADFPAGTYFVQMSVSRNDDVFAFTVKDPADWSVRGYAVWKRSANRVIYNVVTRDLDEVQIDKSGRYLGVKTPFQGAGLIQAKVVDLNTLQVTDLTDNAPGYAPGHGDYGTGIVAAHDNWTNRLTIRNLATPLDVSTMFSFGNDWLIDYHLSLLADNEDWALMSVYNSGPVFNRELVMVATDGSGRFRRFAHHYSRMVGYLDSPRANLSRDGRFAAFTSNWGGRDRRDLFIVRVPSDSSSPPPTPAPTPTPIPSPSPQPSPSPSPTVTPTPAPNPGNQVKWNNVRSTASLDGSVWFTGETTAGMARSQQVLSKFSSFEWTYNSSAGPVWVGLGVSYNEKPGSGANDLPYCFEGGSIKEMGVRQASFGIVNGDRLRIEINRKGQVIYRRNGLVVYRSRTIAQNRYYLVFKAKNVAGIKVSDARFTGVNLSP